MEAISNAGSCVGVLTKEGVVLGAEKRITSKVRERRENNKIRMEEAGKRISNGW